MVTALSLSTSAAARPGFEHPPETYFQEITVRFSSAHAAERARFAVTPLHDDYHRAVSCRWDDNVTSANEETRTLRQNKVDRTELTAALSDLATQLKATPE